MAFRLLADMAVIAHLAFILFGLLGGFCSLWRPWLALVHLPTAAWIILLELRGWSCPLTSLENALLVKAGNRGYPGGFVEHYIVPIVYPPGLTPSGQAILGIVALAINILVYGVVIYRLRRTGEGAPSGRARR